MNDSSSRARSPRPGQADEPRIRGVAADSVVAGLVDVDAIALSVSSMFNQGQMKSSVAAIAILLSAPVNTLVKPSLMMVIAGFRASIRVWLVLLAALVAGWLAYWLQLST